MAGIDIKNFLRNFTSNAQTFSARSSINAKFIPQNPVPSPSQIPDAPKIPVPDKPPTLSPSQLQNMQMQSMERAVFAKDVLGFPRNVNEFIYMLQKGLNQAQLNQMYANQLGAQRMNLSQMQAQILAQLQGLDISSAKVLANAQLSSQLQLSLKDLKILSNGMINLNQVAQMIQQNGKEGITKLIMAMTEASKSGITDTNQLKEMAKLINASVSIAAENNPQKTLKLLLMLYLPWLPLEDGVGFDLEIQPKNDSSDDSDSIITITVNTVNFGVVTAVLYLESSNSVQVSVECSEDFPKNELKLRIDNEQKYYSMDSVVNISTNNTKAKSQEQSANINMSQTTEINPYLLLMAHLIIKQVIDIDNNKTAGIVSHVDK